MSSTVTELVFFQVRPDIKPEAPETNQESENLLKLIQDNKQQHGYQRSAWGRTVEDENVMIWIISWSDARGASRAKLLTPYLAPTTEVLTMYTTMTPPPDIGTLCASPVNELCPLTFATSLTPDEYNDLSAALAKTGKELTENIPNPGDRPLHFSIGHVDRPGIRSHPTSPSGEAFVMFLIVGWESVEAHKRARETAQFKDNFWPIGEKMLPTGAGLLPGTGWGMSHAKFREL